MGPCHFERAERVEKSPPVSVHADFFPSPKILCQFLNKNRYICSIIDKTL